MLVSSSAWDSDPTCVCLPLWLGIRVLQTGGCQCPRTEPCVCVCVVCVSVGVRVSVKQWFSVFASLCVPVCWASVGACSSMWQCPVCLCRRVLV